MQDASTPRSHVAPHDGLRGHFASLDGLRGLAALVVVVRHSLGALDVPPSLLEDLLASPLILFLNATGAVQLFFVLSGFVLAGSLLRQWEPRQLPLYAVRRVFRIHPPYACAVLAAWGASFLYLPGERVFGVSRWVEVLSRIHLAPAALAKSLLFPGNAGLQLSVGWSLEVEMLLSLAMPLLLLAALRTHWLLVLAACALPVALDHRVLKFAFDFALGIALFLERERLGRWLGWLGPVAGAALLAAALLLLHLPYLARWQVSPGGDPHSMPWLGLGAAGLTACAAFLPLARRSLASRPCRFLGRISYSLYLVHYPIVLLLAPRLVARPLGPFDFVLLLAAVLALALPLSALSHRFVELPAIRAGNRLAARIAGWQHVRFTPSEAGKESGPH